MAKLNFGLYENAGGKAGRTAMAQAHMAGAFDLSATGKVRNYMRGLYGAASGVGKLYRIKRRNYNPKG